MSNQKPWVLNNIYLIIFNPITITSFAAPTLINAINLVKLKFVLLQPAYSDRFKNLANIVNSEWYDYLIDIHIQYVILFAAFVFTFIEVVKGIWAIIKYKRPVDTVEKIKESNHALVYFLFSLVVIIIISVSFIFGLLLTPEQIDLYKTNSEFYKTLNFPIFEYLHPPPLASLIFWLRLILIIYGIYTTGYFLKNILPSVISESVTPKEISEETGNNEEVT